MSSSRSATRLRKYLRVKRRTHIAITSMLGAAAIFLAILYGVPFSLRGAVVATSSAISMLLLALLWPPLWAVVPISYWVWFGSALGSVADQSANAAATYGLFSLFAFAAMITPFIESARNRQSQTP